VLAVSEQHQFLRSHRVTFFVVLLLPFDVALELHAGDCAMSLEEEDQEVIGGLSPSRELVSQQLDVTIELRDVASDGHDAEIKRGQLGPNAGSCSVCIQMTLPDNDLEEKVAGPGQHAVRPKWLPCLHLLWRCCS
jgi:hypothetical protein